MVCRAWFIVEMILEMDEKKKMAHTKCLYSKVLATIEAMATTEISTDTDTPASGVVSETGRTASPPSSAAPACAKKAEGLPRQQLEQQPQQPAGHDKVAKQGLPTYATREVALLKSLAHGDPTE